MNNSINGTNDLLTNGHQNGDSNEAKKVRLFELFIQEFL
jgi:hypothetical protein